MAESPSQLEVLAEDDPRNRLPVVERKKMPPVSGDLGMDPSAEMLRDGGGVRTDPMAWIALQVTFASQLARDADILKESVLTLKKNLEVLAQSDIRLPSKYSLGSSLPQKGNGSPSQEEATALNVTILGEKDSPTVHERAAPDRLGTDGKQAAFKPASAVPLQNAFFVEDSSAQGVDGDFEEVPDQLLQSPSHLLAQANSTDMAEEPDFSMAVESQEVSKLVHMMEKHAHQAKVVKHKEGKTAKLVKSEVCGWDEPPRSGWLYHLLHSMSFERMLAGVIVLNAVFMGIVLDENIKNPQDNTTQFIKVVEVAFLVFYGLELVVKLMVHRLYFFVNDEWAWNCLDFLLVIISVQDILWLDAGVAGNGFNVAFIRIIRLARVSKMFRVFKVMVFFKELRIMLKCISGSLRSLLWSIIMLALFYYIFAVIFMNGAVTYAKENPDGSDLNSLMEWYGSLPICMRSLFMASTGGADWREISRPLLAVGDFYYGFFLFYVAFMFLAVMNVVTGIFVDTAIQASRTDVEGIIRSQVEEERRFEECLAGLFVAMDTDGDGILTCEEFCSHLHEGAHYAFFATLGLEITDTKEFFQSMQRFLHRDTIDQKAFHRVLRRFRRTAKFSDIFLLRLHAVDTQHRLASIQRSLDLSHTVKPQAV